MHVIIKIISDLVQNNDLDIEKYDIQQLPRWPIRRDFISQMHFGCFGMKRGNLDFANKFCFLIACKLL